MLAGRDLFPLNKAARGMFFEAHASRFMIVDTSYENRVPRTQRRIRLTGKSAVLKTAALAGLKVRVLHPPHH